MSGSGQSGAERRRTRRAALKLRGRFLLADGGEHPCETIDISVTGLALRAYLPPRNGERILTYIDDLGRLEGVVLTQRADGFVLELISSASRAAKLAQRIAELSGEAQAGAYGDPSAAHFRQGELRVEFGPSYSVRVAEETAVSARILSSFSLLPGTRVLLDGRRATVQHDNGGGFVIRFER